MNNRPVITESSIKNFLQKYELSYDNEKVVKIWNELKDNFGEMIIPDHFEGITSEKLLEELNIPAEVANACISWSVSSNTSGLKSIGNVSKSEIMIEQNSASIYISNKSISTNQAETLLRSLQKDYVVRLANDIQFQKPAVDKQGKEIPYSDMKGSWVISYLNDDFIVIHQNLYLPPKATDAEINDKIQPIIANEIQPTLAEKLKFISVTKAYIKSIINQEVFFTNNGNISPLNLSQRDINAALLGEPLGTYLISANQFYVVAHNSKIVNFSLERDNIAGQIHQFIGKNLGFFRMKRNWVGGPDYVMPGYQQLKPLIPADWHIIQLPLLDADGKVLSDDKAKQSPSLCHNRNKHSHPSSRDFITRNKRGIAINDRLKKQKIYLNGINIVSYSFIINNRPIKINEIAFKNPNEDQDLICRSLDEVEQLLRAVSDLSDDMQNFNYIEYHNEIEDKCYAVTYNPAPKIHCYDSKSKTFSLQDDQSEDKQKIVIEQIEINQFTQPKDKQKVLKSVAAEKIMRQEAEMNALILWRAGMFDNKPRVVKIDTEYKKTHYEKK